jgi:cell division protein FtsX
VGASGTLIRWPYIFESVLLSLFALALSGALVVGAILLLNPYLAGFLGTDPGLLAYFERNAAPIVGGEFAALVFLTGIASTYAVGRHMKV